jgi:hypothetical protein
MWTSHGDLVMRLNAFLARAIGILGESPFVSKLRKEESAQPRIHTDAGRAAPRPQDFSPLVGFYLWALPRQIRPAPVKLAFGLRNNALDKQG